MTRCDLPYWIVRREVFWPLQVCQLGDIIHFLVIEFHVRQPIFQWRGFILHILAAFSSFITMPCEWAICLRRFHQLNWVLTYIDPPCSLQDGIQTAIPWGQPLRMVPSSLSLDSRSLRHDSRFCVLSKVGYIGCLLIQNSPFSSLSLDVTYQSDTRTQLNKYVPLAGDDVSDLSTDLSFYQVLSSFALCLIFSWANNWIAIFIQAALEG